MVHLKGEYLKTVHFRDKVYYRMPVGNHSQAIEWYQFQ